MTDIPLGKLRNDISAVMQRVEAGESLRVTVNGRPVAQLAPLPARPSSMAWEEFQRSLAGAHADHALAAELATLVPDTTDDVR